MRGKLKKLERMVGLRKTDGYQKVITYFVTRCWDKNGQVYYEIDDRVKVASLEEVNKYIKTHCEELEPWNVLALYQVGDCDFICDQEESIEDELKSFLGEHSEYQDGNCHILGVVGLDSPNTVIKKLYQKGFDEETISRCVEAYYNEDWKEYYSRESVEKIWEEIRMEYRSTK